MKNTKVLKKSVTMRKPITNKQLMPFYKSVRELISLLQEPEFISDGYLMHIDYHARKLATSLKLHLESGKWTDAYHDDGYKCNLPLLTGREHSELKELVSRSNNKKLIEKINDYDCIFDFDGEQKGE